MRINSINNSYMPAKNFSGSRQTKSNNNISAPNIQFEGQNNNNDKNGDKSLKKAAKYSVGALAASMLLGAGMSSCDKFDTEITTIIPLPVDTVNKYIPIVLGSDTVKVPVIIPGKDSIIWKDSLIHDTILMASEYNSPVAPIIKKFYEVLNINPGSGRIPVKMVWTDEKDGSYNKSVFDGRSSSINQMTFNITKTPFDENAGGVILGKNEQYYRLKFSKINDNALSLIFEKPRIEGKPEDGRDDQWRPVEYYIYDIYSDQVKRYELNDDNSTGDRGEFLPGDIPSSIILQNIYGDKYRYSSLSVQSTDSPSKTEDYED